MPADKDVDVVGKSCPLPLIMLAREVRGLQQGQTVRITGNDPIFEESIIEFCRERCFTIVETSREGKTVSMVIRL